MAKGRTGKYRTKKTASVGSTIDKARNIGRGLEKSGKGFERFKKMQGKTK